VGKARVAIWSMLASATCAALTVVAYGRSPIWLFILIAIWGFTVVADSAQFSALVSELAPPDYIGTALTLQTSIGFLLTMVTIEMMPRVADYFGWRWASLLLVPGPLLGSWAMSRLRAPRSGAAGPLGAGRSGGAVPLGV
jgi:MFS family permease